MLPHCLTLSFKLADNIFHRPAWLSSLWFAVWPCYCTLKSTTKSNRVACTVSVILSLQLLRHWKWKRIFARFGVLKCTHAVSITFFDDYSLLMLLLLTFVCQELLTSGEVKPEVSADKDVMVGGHVKSD